MRRLEGADARELATLYDDLVLPDGVRADSQRRSWLALGMVSSVDGGAAIDGRTSRLGGEADRLAFGRLRTACDAILVGAGTVRAEGYRPPVGDAGRRAARTARGLAAAPRLVIVTSSLRLSREHPVFSDPAHRPIVVTHEGHDDDAIRGLADVAEVLRVGSDTVDVDVLLQVLADRGLARVLCEGGPLLAGTLHARDLVDEVFVTIAPTLVGGRSPRIVVGDAEAARPMTLHDLHEHDGELLLRYRRRRDGAVGGP